MVVYELEVIDGPDKGAHGPFRINLYNASDKARAIAESQQAALCYVTGVFMLEDTVQLHNRPFVVDVEEQPLTPQQVAAQAEGKTVTPFTQVRKILDMDCNEPKGGQAQAPAAAPAPAAAGWGQGAAATPAASPAPAAAPAAAWSQGASAAASGGTPAWGKR